MKRDPKGSLLYWNTWINFHEKNIDKMWTQARGPFPNHEYRPQFLFEISRKYADLTFYRYSRGDELDTLLQYFSGLLEAWEESVSLGKNTWDAETQFARTSWEVNIDLYSLCFRLAGLALLLDIPDSQWQRLNALMGNEGKDAVLDRVIASRQPERPIGENICFPQAYLPLLEVIDASEEQQAMLLNRYVKSWFPSLRNAGSLSFPPAHRTPYWWNSCADEERGMQGTYHGCWCIEAATVAKIFSIDDSNCVSLPFYPADLLINGRSPRYPDVASPFEPGHFAKKGAAGWFNRILGKVGK